jgi:hypothetical protein
LSQKIMISQHVLSPRDAGILNLIFDPESQATKPEPVNTSPSLPEPRPSMDELRGIRRAESSAIRLAEIGSLDEAERLLSDIIAKYSTVQPSLWSNRAQVRRLTGNVQGALDDISEAIRITTPLRNTMPSTENARILSHAHTHRATIYLLVARGEITGILQGQSPEQLEERASHDFAVAGRYGSDLAKAMAVRTNPYAKMCGAIVQTALKKEMDPAVSSRAPGCT